MTETYHELPSGHVLCSLRLDSGAIMCTSDTTQGDYDKRAQNALEKVIEIQRAMQYLNMVESGQIVDVVV